MSVQCLYNSAGFDIANIVNGQLHAVRGENIGHPASSGGFFIDMQGHYLGEIINDMRLLDNLSHRIRVPTTGHAETTVLSAILGIPEACGWVPKLIDSRFLGNWSKSIHNSLENRLAIFWRPQEMQASDRFRISWSRHCRHKLSLNRFQGIVNRSAL